jgi:hypothetical protein
MKVKWIEFNSDNYRSACDAFPYEADPADFRKIRKGEVIDTFVAHNEPMFLVRVGKTFMTAKATECEVIED